MSSRDPPEDKWSKPVIEYLKRSSRQQAGSPLPFTGRSFTSSGHRSQPDSTGAAAASALQHGHAVIQDYTNIAHPVPDFSPGYFSRGRGLPYYPNVEISSESVDAYRRSANTSGLGVVDPSGINAATHSYRRIPSTNRYNFSAASSSPGYGNVPTEVAEPLSIDRSGRLHDLAVLERASSASNLSEAFTASGNAARHSLPASPTRSSIDHIAIRASLSTDRSGRLHELAAPVRASSASKLREALTASGNPARHSLPASPTRSSIDHIAIRASLSTDRSGRLHELAAPVRASTAINLSEVLTASGNTARHSLPSSPTRSSINPIAITSSSTDRSGRLPDRAIPVRASTAINLSEAFTVSGNTSRNSLPAASSRSSKPPAGLAELLSAFSNKRVHLPGFAAKVNASIVENMSRNVVTSGNKAEQKIGTPHNKETEQLSPPERRRRIRNPKYKNQTGPESIREVSMLRSMSDYNRSKLPDRKSEIITLAEVAIRDKYCSPLLFSILTTGNQMCKYTYSHPIHWTTPDILLVRCSEGEEYAYARLRPSSTPSRKNLPERSTSKRRAADNSKEKVSSSFETNYMNLLTILLGDTNQQEFQRLMHDLKKISGTNDPLFAQIRALLAKLDLQYNYDGTETSTESRNNLIRDLVTVLQKDKHVKKLLTENYYPSC